MNKSKGYYEFVINRYERTLQYIHGMKCNNFHKYRVLYCNGSKFKKYVATVKKKKKMYDLGVL